MTNMLSADFAGLSGGDFTGSNPGVFSDDMQDVPLHNSGTRAPAGSSSAHTTAPASRTTLTRAPRFPFPYRQHQLRVTVHSPESMKPTLTIPSLAIPYTMYTVDTTSTPGSGFPQESSSVKRRFSDFAALHASLVAQYEGYFVPPPPDKDLLQAKVTAGKFFILTRTQDLEVFINRCCDHDLLRASKALQVFLTLPTDTLLQHKEWQRVEQQERMFQAFKLVPRILSGRQDAPQQHTSQSTLGKVGESIKTTFWQFSKQVQTHVQSTLASGKEPPKQSGSLEEDTLQKTAALMVERSSEYGILIQKWSYTAQATDTLGVALKEMGIVFTRLQEFEDKAATVSHGLQEYAKAADRALLPLKHVETGLRSGQRAFADRHQLFIALKVVEAQAQDKRERHRMYSSDKDVNEVQGSQGLDDIQRSVGKLEEEVQALKKDYETVSEVNRAEKSKVMKEVNQMVPLAVHQAASLHADLMDSMAEAWAQLAANLGASNGGI